MFGVSQHLYVFLVTSIIISKNVSTGSRASVGLQPSQSQSTAINTLQLSSAARPGTTTGSTMFTSTPGGRQTVISSYDTSSATSSPSSNLALMSLYQTVLQTASPSSIIKPGIIASHISSSSSSSPSPLSSPPSSSLAASAAAAVTMAPSPMAILTSYVMPKHCGSVKGCCFKALSQLPGRIRFSESLLKGSILADVRGVENVTFDVTVSSPAHVRNVIKDYFVIVQTSAYEYRLILDEMIDLENLFLQSGQSGDVHEFQVSVKCTEDGSLGPMVPVRIVNVTVEDVDDAMPVFLYSNGNPECEVPIYKANTTEDYMGLMVISPVQIQAVDGDVMIQHNITYRVMHSEPDDYHVYFSLDSTDGTVNKTKVMDSSMPKKYVLFVEAVEDSTLQRSRVAVLAIDVYPRPYRYGRSVQTNQYVRISLVIISALLLIAFIAGMIVICHHRYRLKRARVASELTSIDVIRDVTYPRRTINTSVTSLDYKPMTDVPPVASPSQIVVNPSRSTLFAEKPKKTVIKRPLDTKNRPQWNAPKNTTKRTVYEPYIRPR